MAQKYFRLRITGIRTEDLDLLSDLCFDYGATGVEEVLEYRQPDLVYDPIVTAKAQHDINVYFDSAPGILFFQDLQKKFPTVDAVTFEEESRDWLAEWKKGFEPFPLAAGYWVVPSWTATPAQATKPLILDPGMAFGTGTHATTQLAADLLLGLNEIQKKGAHLDVGTGTGILAMIAAFEGSKSVVGLDIDPEARRTARENIQRNKCTNTIVSDLTIEQWAQPMDVVIANIIDGVLLQLKHALVRSLRPGGTIILSGILVERENLFLANFLDGTNLKVEERKTKDEWVAFRLHRPD